MKRISRRGECGAIVSPVYRILGVMYQSMLSIMDDEINDTFICKGFWGNVQAHCNEYVIIYSSGNCWLKKNKKQFTV